MLPMDEQTQLATPFQRAIQGLLDIINSPSTSPIIDIRALYNELTQVEEGELLCPQCGVSFKPKNKWQVRCSRVCSKEYWKIQERIKRVK